MTVATTTSIVAHTGNGVTTEFPFDFPIPTEDQMVVYLQDATTYETTEVLTAEDYSVNFNADLTGEVVYSGPLSSDFRIVIERTVPYTQELALSRYDGFDATAIMTALDNVEMQIQQLNDKLARAPVVEYGQLPTVIYDGEILPANIPTQGITGYLAYRGTSLYTAGRNAVNVLDYGADPTGVESSVEAFNKARLENGTVFFPAGTYLIDEEFETGFDVVIKGDGPNKTILKVTSPSFWKLTGTDVQYEQAGICDLTIFAMVEPGDDNYCIWADGVSSSYRQSFEALNVVIRSGDDLPVGVYGYMNYFRFTDLQLPVINGCLIRGSYSTFESPSGRPETCAIRWDGQTIDPFISQTVVGGVFRGLYITDQVEGFWYTDTDFIGVWQGVVIDNAAPGGWFNSGHINSVAVGVLVEDRTGAMIQNLFLYRSNVFYATDYKALHLNNCDRVTINTLDIATQNDAGTYDLIEIEDCNAILLSTVTLNGSPATTTVNGIKHTGANTNCVYNGVIFNGVTTAFSTTANDSNITLGPHEFWGTVTTKYSIATKKTSIRLWNKYLNYNRSVSSSPTPSANTEVLTKGDITGYQFTSRNFAAGGGAYTYNIDLSTTDILEGDFFDLKTILPSSTNPTVQIRNGEGGSVLVTMNVASSTRYFTRCVYDNTGNWVVADHHETLV